MKILVTGATGFVGRHVVEAARAGGHDVRALVRPASVLPFGDDPGITVIHRDLRTRTGLEDALTGIDAVIHLAATKAGEFYTQFAGTVAATENLLAAMDTVGVTRLVGVSTFSVYDYRNLATGELVTEETPIDGAPARRDEYARTKLIQEQLYLDWSDNEHRVAVARPGMIYGRDNLWHALLGAELGPRFLRIGSSAVLPLTYVENCAEALVLAAEVLAVDPSPVAGEIVNIVDDDLPTQADYVAAVSNVIEPPPSISVPWPVMRTAAGVLDWGNERFLGGRAKFPGIVVPERLHARFKPLRYTNAKAKRLLGWTPRFGLGEALARSVAEAERVGASSGG